MTEPIRASTLLPTGKPHISYSEARNWVECSFRHDLLYVKKLGTDAPSIHLSFGTAAHAVCERYFNTRQVDLSVGTKIIDADWKKHAEWEDFAENPKEGFVESLTNIMADFPSFLEATFPGWELHKAEEPLYENIGQFFEKHDGLSFKGFIDVVLKVPVAKKPGEFLYWIVDLKTANRPWNKWKLQDPTVGLQVALYKTVWAAKHGVPLKSIRCGFLTLLKSGKPGKLCKLIPFSVGETTSERSLKVLNNSLTAIKKGFALKNRSSCKFCEFKDTPHCP